MIVARDLCFKQSIWTAMWELDYENSVMSQEITEGASELQWVIIYGLDKELK